MANPRELEDVAMRLARQHFDESVAQVLDAADGDRDAVSEAAKTLSANTSRADNAEHVAFAFLTAAFMRLAAEGGTRRSS
jgi:hypothetical protein